MLPEVRSSSEVYGETDAGRCSAPPCRSPGSPAISRRRSSGRRASSRARAKNTYGTGCFMLLNTGETPVPSHEGPAHDGGVADRRPHDVRARRFGVRRRCRRAVAARRAEGDRRVGRCRAADGAGVRHRRRLPGAGVRRAWGRPIGIRARAAPSSGSRATPRIAHVARAAVDAMAYQTRDVLEVMQEEAGPDADDAQGGRRRGGQRDAAAVPGRPARRARCAGRWSRETTALGAAYLAGLAVGYWDGLDDVRRNWALDREFAPQMDEDTRARLYRGWKKAVSRSLAWEE